MAVRQIRNAWWVDFRIDYIRYRKKSPENSRAGALAYEAMLRQKLARGDTIDRASGNSPQDQTLEQFAKLWFDDYVVPNNKLSEQCAKRHILSAVLVPYFGKMRVTQISEHHIEQFKAQQMKAGIHNKTVKNRLTVLSKCLGTAYEWMKIDSRPPRIKWPKCPPVPIDYLTPDECALLLAHSSGVLREMILLGLRTGMRQGELKGLQWSSLDWTNRSVCVRHSRNDHHRLLEAPKSNRERHIPLDHEVHELLQRRRRATGYVFLDEQAQPFNHQKLTRQLGVVCEAAGLRKISWHILRHTFATHLAMKGAPLNLVQQLLGHASITTTMRYAHVAPSMLRAAIDMLNPNEAKDFGHPVGNAWRGTRSHPIEQTASPTESHSF